MKKDYKVYLETEDLKRLQEKAEELGISGKGWLSHYISRLAKEKIVLLDKNVKALLNALNFKPT